MTPRFSLGCVVVALAVGGWTTCAQAQAYGDSGAVADDPSERVPPISLVSFDSYLPDPWTAVPPPARYFPGPGFRYNANPLAQVPNTFSYEMPPNAYMPNTYTYDLRAYGYNHPGYSYPYGYNSPYGFGYPYGYPPAMVPVPVYPFGYFPNPYLDYYPAPQRRRGTYRPMTLREYIARELRGPTRVRDVVPGIPELGGGPLWGRR